MSKSSQIFYIAAFFFCASCVAYTAKDNEPLNSQATPVLRAHAHNDYQHRRPLLDALDNGFCSVEADVFLVNDALLVAHFLIFVRPNRTLESLYLEPLRKRTQQYNGKIYPDAERFYLWIEIKSDAEKTYAVLRNVLEQYADILTRYEHGVEIPGAVTVILTGKAGLGLIQNESVRYACIDGRLSALNSDVSADLIPVVSLNWRSEFSGFTGTLTSAEREKLAEQVRKAHERGRKLRYWNTPDHEKFWKILLDAEVDFINTDRLESLRIFLEKSDMRSRRSRSVQTP